MLADFSPKNILVHSQGLTLVDFETAHAGDPAFDLGFFLSHLYLKGLRGPNRHEMTGLIDDFLAAYREGGGVIAADLLGGGSSVAWHTAACMLARVDGKSPVDYLDEEARMTARARSLEVLRGVPTH